MKSLNEKVREWAEMAHEMVAKLDELETTKLELATAQAEIKALKAELDAMKKADDEWASRVTYENVVDQIALYEDPAQRDEARKVFAPLLKKNMVTKMHRDIKRRAKELNGEGANITIQQAEVKVQSPGNNIAHTIINKE